MARGAIDAGEVVASLPGRYVSFWHQYAFVPRAHAALAATRGVLTGEAALYLRRAVDRAPRQVLVGSPRGRSAGPRDWLATFTTDAPMPHSRIGALDVATAPMACVHQWTRGDVARRTGAVLAALQRRVTDPDELRRTMAAMPRIRDRAELEDVIAAFDAGAHSYLEHRSMTTVLVGREFSRLVRQHEVFARGRRRFLDTYDPVTLTAIELDGSEHHLAGERREEDIERDADLATIGIQTIRLSYAKVTRSPAWCRETVRAVLAARASQFSA